MIIGTIKILIVEDEAAIARDLESILEDCGYQVSGIAHNYEQAVEEIKNDQPDFALLDISLKGSKTGIDVAKYINEFHKFPFVFITSFSSDDILTEAIGTSPGGYLVKPFKERDIPAVIKVALMNTRKVISFPSLKQVNERLEETISAQEHKVLECIWSGQKNSEIASSLFLSVNTIKTHITRVFSKLSVHSRAEAINKIMNL